MKSKQRYADEQGTQQQFAQKLETLPKQAA